MVFRKIKKLFTKKPVESETIRIVKIEKIDNVVEDFLNSIPGDAENE